MCLKTYLCFAKKVEETKRNLLNFLIKAKREGKSIAGYGAPGKGNTLLNYCGIRTDFIDYTVDRNPYKHGKYTPGTHIPIYDPEGSAKQSRITFLFFLGTSDRNYQTASLRARVGCSVCGADP